ncbi:MAG: biopolymer transporter ExbD [Marinobacter sp.]|nr:biopolymer transporter ExbD [Marinobacter sp.]
MKFKRQRSQEVGVDLTPLIDVVFLLLIFFMVSTTFTRESHLTVELPEAKGQKNETDVKQIDVVINAQGQYYVNDKPLINSKLETLQRAIHELAGDDTGLPFVITADAKTAHEYVVRAMDVAGRLGFSKLSITTQQAGAER